MTRSRSFTAFAVTMRICVPMTASAKYAVRPFITIAQGYMMILIMVYACPLPTKTVILGDFHQMHDSVLPAVACLRSIMRGFSLTGKRNRKIIRTQRSL